MNDWSFQLPDGIYTIGYDPANPNGAVFHFEPLVDESSRASIAECQRIWDLGSPE